MRIGDLIPDAGELQAEIELVPQAQRVALALQLVRDIDDPGCALALMRLSRLADEQQMLIRREAFVRDHEARRVPG